MALEDKDFIEKQVNLAAKGLAKMIDMEVLEKMFSKENVETMKAVDENRKEADE